MAHRRGHKVHKIRTTKLDPPKSDINVTPLVDVCLVLLIIFMVITPMMSRGKEVPLPKTQYHFQRKDKQRMLTISAALASHADGLVLLRSDGMPTYHFASIVDDIHAGTTLILRGMDHLANTPKQVLVALVLAQAGWPGADDFCRNVRFAHVGLILTKDGKKVSKRDSSSNVMATLDGSVDARAYLQWVLKLGWGHPASDFDKQHPLLSLNDMASVFSQGGLRSTNATLDLPKLDSLNRLWSRKSSDQYP